MQKNTVLLILTTSAILISIASFYITIQLLESLQTPVLITTGRATSTGTVTLVQTGSAGIQLSDNTISFGSGYFNGTCNREYAIIHSNTTKSCWVNTSTFPTSNDIHSLVNSGNSIINITAAVVNISDAEEIFCNSAQGCLASLTSEILIQTINGEEESCPTINTNPRTLATNRTNYTQSICEILNFQDSTDSLSIFLELHIPKDIKSGTKTIFILYEATAL